ncbi:MAG: tetratricopeptide (TPR) repeat protein [Planctomycetota bacterium]|jgi:tetratricopeptide (TPR) repeat protein
MIVPVTLTCLLAALASVPFSIGSSAVVTRSEVGLKWIQDDSRVPNYDSVGMHLEVKTVFDEARERVAVSPEDPSTWWKLGALYDAHELHRQAEICYRRAHVLDPKDFGSVYLLAIVSVHLGLPLETTVALFRTAVALRPDYAPVFLNMGNALAREGNISEAREAYKQALSINKNFFAAHLRIGQILLVTGELEEARDHLLKAWQGAADDSEINASLAQVYMRLGDRTLAREYAERTRSMSRSLSYYDRVRSEMLALALDTYSRVSRARKAFEQGEFDKALIELETILRLHPTQAEAHVMLGGILLQKGQLKEALIHLEKSVLHSPQDADKRLVYGQALLNSSLDDPAALKKSVQILRSGVQLDPADDEIREVFAIALARRGRHDQSLIQFERAAANGRQLSEMAYSLWGSVLGVEGHLQQAHDCFRDAFMKLPESSELCFNLAVAMDQLGRAKEAIAQYELAIELGTTMPAKERADALR